MIIWQFLSIEVEFRIVLAIDLEIWYLFSLRFVSAIKLLGPKLFMIRNMVLSLLWNLPSSFYSIDFLQMRDLIGIIYIIFICIAAYGVVSRALISSTILDFTANNISSSVFYQPYWLLYSIADDEKANLDGHFQLSYWRVSNDIFLFKF